MLTIIKTINQEKNINNYTPIFSDLSNLVWYAAMVIKRICLCSNHRFMSDLTRYITSSINHRSLSNLTIRDVLFSKEFREKFLDGLIIFVGTFRNI